MTEARKQFSEEELVNLTMAAGRDQRRQPAQHRLPHRARQPSGAAAGGRVGCFNPAAPVYHSAEPNAGNTASGAISQPGEAAHVIGTDHAANRRRFLQYLAASPLMAAGSASAFAETLLPKSMVPDPLMWGPRQSDHLIKSSEGSHQRLRLRAGLPAERAAGAFRLHGVGHRRRGDAARQPRGLSEIPAPAAAAGRRQQGRHERRYPRHALPLADCLAPVGGQRSFHDEGEVAPRAPRKAGNHLQILSTMTRTAVEEVTKARGAPIWFSSTPPTNGRWRRRSPTRAENAGCTAVAVTVDRSGGRNQETLSRLRPSDTRDCNGCHDRSNLQTNLRSRAMYQGLDITGLRNTQSSAMTWDYFKRLRDVPR